MAGAAVQPTCRAKSARAASSGGLVLDPANRFRYVVWVAAIGPARLATDDEVGSACREIRVFICPS
jgi:hypothetical protein